MRPPVRLVVGVVVVVLLVAGEPALGWLLAPGKVGDGLAQVDSETAVVVQLAVEPQRFHVERLSQFGFYGGREGDPRRIRLTRVRPDAVREIASLLWVQSVEIAQG
ncbi:MAG: hypothetical protein GEU81_11810 [Nitriliruptorales bacterium]|nr:hypothetical protein [Nitriliruptorales bacterium]